MSNADVQIQQINAQLKPLYAQLSSGDTGVQDTINSLVAQRTQYEKQAQADAQLSYDWQAAKDYITQDAGKVTTKAASNIYSTAKTAVAGIFSFTKWIVVGIVVLGIIYLVFKFKK